MFKINLFGNNIDKLTDAELIKKIYWWRYELYINIYEKYKTKIYNYILNLLWHNIYDAYIIITDIFTKLWESTKDGKCNEVINLNAYIYRLAHNTCINFMKSRWSRTYQNIEDVEWSLVADGNPSEYMTNIYQTEQLQKYLKLLDANSRSVIYMVYFEDKNYEEIAQIIWSNKNTVWTILSRAKKKLREIMWNENFNL